jgi:branched-chain amino acid transport system ATP-binding protein
LLEIARALATEPTLLLLDEPAAGLTPQEADRIMDLIFKIREQGTTILLVEHNMRLVMKISDEVVVLNYGKKIAEGPPPAIQNNDQVIEIYLGKDVHFA